jgi:hypothetical protein
VSYSFPSGTTINPQEKRDQMKLENGFWFCKCGLRAEHKASIGWRCPEHGVAGYKENK